jgi:hypothetical protein
MRENKTSSSDIVLRTTRDAEPIAVSITCNKYSINFLPIVTKHEPISSPFGNSQRDTSEVPIDFAERSHAWDEFEFDPNGHVLHI